MEEVEGGSHREQHVVVVSLVQDDENQIADLETDPPPKQKILRLPPTANVDGHVNNVDNHATPGAIRAQRKERSQTLTLEWRFYQSAAKTQTTCSETSAVERRWSACTGDTRIRFVSPSHTWQKLYFKSGIKYFEFLSDQITCFV